MRQPAKRRPKIIIYNVSKDTIEEELKDALGNQNDVPNADNNVIFKMVQIGDEEAACEPSEVSLLKCVDPYRGKKQKLRRNSSFRGTKV